MRPNRFLAISFLIFLCPAFFSPPAAMAESLKERNEVLFGQLQKVHGLSEGQMDSIRTLFRESGYMGQGNPAVAKHPLTSDG